MKMFDAISELKGEEAKIFLMKMVQREMSRPSAKEIALAEEIKALNLEVNYG